MTLSFVVPAYNEERYLPDCLQSILKETAGRTDVEIIVVNNASTDSTRAVALSFPGVRVVDEPRKGLPHARQAGFLASSGRLICNVDSDSRLPEGWVAQVLRTFAADPELVTLSGPLVYYDLTPRESLLVRVFYATAWMTYALNRYVLRVGSMVQGGNFVVTREALEAIGGFNLDLTFYGEDTDLARRLPEVGRVLFTFDLKMFSSARRLKKEGIFTMACRYSMNYLWTIFLKRPYSEDHIDIREGSGA
ncbi:MAG TPA: glycosyltransferase family A protein [Acidobacteriaceae bacterium]|nr:glycosyltransferase family A protein [Acidobacteriaceae bacterium]